MKNVLSIIAVALTMVACGNKKTTDTNMNTLSFNQEQATWMSAIACNEAKADYVALTEAINGGLDAGLTVGQVKEALSQLYAYTGFPRSLNALGTLQRVLEQRQAAGKTTVEGEDASPLPSSYDALKQGTEVQTKLSGHAFDYAFSPAEDYYLKAHLFGDIFARDNLTHADRELITVSALSGLENVIPQLQAHVRGALNMGVTEEQLRGIPAALKAKGMVSEASRAEAAISTVVDGKSEAFTPSEWPLGQPNTMFAKYFTGNSYLAVLNDKGLCNVTFEPGCRNNWHIHHGAVQVLICVAGHGWYQEWGKDAVALTPGMVITIPEGVKHWHGAAADSWFQHLTYHADAQQGNSTEWLEPVDDPWYEAL
ncbi:MAG: carboxymuconolactone decarboxylase family protein [Bacteroidales bacterium]|nr:carboxymuconolactone decarboxylase family protein [Bacteroidales bacterium]